MQLPNSVSNLPHWAIPVAIGGAGGLFVLVRHKGTKTIGQPIPVAGQDPGTTTANTDTFTAALQAVGKTISDSFSAIQQSESATADLLTTQNQHTMDSITALLTAQSNQEDQRLGALQTLYQSSFSGITDTLTQLMQLIQHPPTTGVTSILDVLRQKFSTAFERITSPPGQAQPGTDITIGTLTNAPYSQDTGFTYYGTSGQYVTGPFRQWLGNKGGAKTWGRPLSQVFKDGGIDTQVFEHVILKYYPGNTADYGIVAIPLT